MRPNLHQRSLVERARRTFIILRKLYRIRRRYSRRWDGACANMRLTWALVDL